MWWAVQVAQRYSGGGRHVTAKFLTDAVVHKHIAKLRVAGRGEAEVEILHENSCTWRLWKAYENDTFCPAVVDRWEPEYAGRVLAVEWGGMML